MIIKVFFPNIKMRSFSPSAPAPFDSVGFFTFLRTYARRHHEDDSNSTIETWTETLTRCLNACETQLKVGFTDDEAKEVFDDLYNLRCSIAGRFLWQLGTRTVDVAGLSSLQNCCFSTVNDPITPFTWTMNFLMCGAGCFPPNTPILTQRGIVPISDVTKDDYVWSYNEKTMEKELKKVLKTVDVFVNKADTIKITTMHGNFITSKIHPILVIREGKWEYIKAGEIVEKDLLQKFVPDSSILYSEVTNIETEIEEDSVFKDLTIEDNNSYYAGNGSFFAVHNCGFRLLPSDVEKLPPVMPAIIKRQDTKDADFIVPDSREGWVKLLEKTLKSRFCSGKSFSYSCILLRSKGAPIKGFGGVASGPEALCEGITNINRVLDKHVGKKIRPVDALDIMNIIGSIVVAGNVRRCYHENALIHCRTGMKRTTDINVGDEVLTSQGYKRIRNIFNQGEQETVSIRTEHGEFICTPNHRMAVLTDESKYEWKEAGNLKSGDSLISSSVPIEGERTFLPHWQDMFQETQELTSEIAWFLGIYQNAGSIVDGKLILYKSVPIESRDRYYKMEHKLFKYIERNIYTTHRYRIPSYVFTAIFSVRVEFLRGVFNDDVKNEIRSNKNFVLDVQKLLYSCGLESFSRKRKDMISKDDNYELILSKRSELCLNGTISLNRISHPSKYYPSIVISVVENEKCNTYDIEVEDNHEFFCDGYLIHNSAQIAIGDCKDIDYLRAKRWDLGNVENWRANSNNSVICNDINDILDNDEFWEGYNGNGEPYGLINLDLHRKCGRIGETQYSDMKVDGCNPCSEQSLESHETCVSGDTPIITKEGVFFIKDLVGKTVEIFNGEEWSEVEPALLGYTDSLIEIEFSDGSKLKTTPNHRFSVGKSEVKAESLRLGDEMPYCIIGIDGVEEKQFSYEYLYEDVSYDVAYRKQLILKMYGFDFDISKTENKYFLSKSKTNKQTVIGLRIIETKREPVYCFTEAKRGMGVFGNVLTYQCCLAELYLPHIKTKEDLFRCARNMYRICKHSLTLPCPHSKETEEVVHRNMRMGIGVTGYLQATEEQRCWLSSCYEYLRAFDVEYSRKHNFPISIKLTCNKPSGCCRRDMLIQTNKGLLRLDEIGDVEGEQWQEIDSLQVLGDGVDKNYSPERTEEFFTCEHIIIQGKRKGEKCGVTTKSTYCKRHQSFHQDEESDYSDSEDENKDVPIFSEKYYNVNKFYINGSVPTKKITTADGLELEVSHQHRFRVIRDGTYEWKRADELEIGDNLACIIGGHPENIKTPLVKVEKNNYQQREMIQPDFLTEDIAWFLGLFYGDGSVHKKGIRISFNRKMPALIQWLFDFFENTFGLKTLIDETGNYYVNSIMFLNWLEENKCLKEKAGYVQIPKLIRTASKDNVKAFINGFWRADGGVHNDANNWSMCSISKIFAQQLMVLCRSVGHNVKIVNAGPSSSSGGKGSNDRWIISVRNQSKNTGKQTKKFRNRTTFPFWNDPVVTIEDSECETYDIEVDTIHHYRLGGVISHNTLSLMAGVTSGIHPAYSQYYIRRIRIASDSPLVKVVREHGYHVEPVKKFDGTLDHTTSVIEFPYSFPDGTVVAENFTAVQQLEVVKRAQKEWSDNAVSVTVTYKTEELPEIKEWLRKNYNDNIKSVSFLLHSGHGFVQAPIEPITKERYLQMVATTRRIENVEGICYKKEEEILDAECAGGACPIK